MVINSKFNSALLKTLNMQEVQEVAGTEKKKVLPQILEKRIEKQKVLCCEKNGMGR